NVVGHYEAWAAGYGSNHGDPKNWQRKHGGSMDSFRAEVAAMAAGEKIEIVYIESPGASGAEKPNTETPGKAAGTAQDAPKVQGGVNMPTIRNGAQGTAVKVMQRLLMLQGAKLSGHGVDGKCGAETVAAVKAFQTAHNLSPDGICGPLTWAALAG
ncbi:MAG: peptidoglycan-binding protein, partial [Clostridia bacterium]|nr:peptidoglycan-binding protein [Clostridia bacterium]